jgi:hypothetical protein
LRHKVERQRDGIVNPSLETDLSHLGGLEQRFSVLECVFQLIERVPFVRVCSFGTDPKPGLHSVYDMQHGVDGFGQVDNVFRAVMQLGKVNAPTDSSGVRRVGERQDFLFELEGCLAYLQSRELFAAYMLERTEHIGHIPECCVYVEKESVEDKVKQYERLGINYMPFVSPQEFYNPGADIRCCSKARKHLSPVAHGS